MTMVWTTTTARCTGTNRLQAHTFAFHFHAAMPAFYVFFIFHIHHDTQYADLGKYGTFEMDISADEGTMTWKSDLANINELATELGIVGGRIPLLNYHLHSFWALPDNVNYAIGGTACGANNTGGHYDPFFAVRYVTRFVELLLLIFVLMITRVFVQCVRLSTTNIVFFCFFLPTICYTVWSCQWRSECHVHCDWSPSRPGTIQVHAGTICGW
jgi:hypothetical protein